MRGLRRGRNRPSPESAQSIEPSSAEASGSERAVRLLESQSAAPVAVVEADSVVEVEMDHPAESAVEVEPTKARSPKSASPKSAPPKSDENRSEVAAEEDRGEVSAKASGGASAGSVVAPAPDRPAPKPPAASARSSPTETTETTDTTEPTSPPQAASGKSLPRVMAVANQKGGVGKTTTSVNLGAALAEIGFRVLVIDLDPQGNATTGLGIDARNFELSMYDVLMRDASLEDCVEPTSMKNLFVAPATIALAGAEIELVPAFSRELKLRRAVESVLDDFDYILIDCPPSLGLITVNAMAAATELLVPIQCEYYALEGLSQLMRNVHLIASNLNPQLDISTIVLTMYDARTKLADQVASEVREHFGSKVCRIVIPRTVRLSEAPSFGQPITVFDSASRGAIAYRELAKEVSGGTS